MMETTPESLLINNNRIAYGIHGEGEPIVLIHGTPSYSYEWRDIIPKLTSSGYRVYVYDLLGYGDSERPIGVDTSVAGQEAILDELINEWGLEQPHVVGHDIGGAIGLRLSISSPTRMSTLTLIDTVSYDSWPSETWQDVIDNHLDEYMALSEQEFRELLTRQLEMTVVDSDLMSGEVLESYLAPHEGPLGRVSFFYHQVRNYDSRYTEEIASELSDIDIPVQIIWGAEDQWQPVEYARRLADDISQSELHLLENTGHFAMDDSPIEVTNHILSFIT